MSISSVFHTINTFASGALAMWVFQTFVWPHVKSAVMAFVGKELAKVNAAAPAAVKPIVADIQKEAAKV